MSMLPGSSSLHRVCSVPGVLIDPGTFRPVYRQAEIWQKKIRVLQKSIASLENSQLTREMCGNFDITLDPPPTADKHLDRHTRCHSIFKVGSVCHSIFKVGSVDHFARISQLYYYHCSHSTRVVYVLFLVPIATTPSNHP